MRHSLAPLCLAALALLAASVAAQAQTSSPNAGALAMLHPDPLRAPVLVVPQADSGSLMLALDIRDGTTDVYAQRLDRRGRPLLGEAGVRVLDVPDNNQNYVMLPDGAGGILLAESVFRGATRRDIVLRRVAPDGSLPYGASGIVICNAPHDQTQPRLLPGPSGSYYVSWIDARTDSNFYRDVYLQRVSLAGAPQWAANGVLVNSATQRAGEAYGLEGFCTDGSGGAIMLWQTNGAVTGRAQKLNSSGFLQWGSNGVPVGTSNRFPRAIVGDGAGGFWGQISDWDGTNNSFYVQHVLSTGAQQFAGLGLSYHPPHPGNVASQLTTNGAGGCFLWGMKTYYSSPSYQLFMRQEVSSTGVLLRGPEGEPVPGGASTNAVVTEAAGAILVATDVALEQGGRTRWRVQRYGYDGIGLYPGVGLYYGREEPQAAVISPVLGLGSNGLLGVAWGDLRYASPSSPVNAQAFAQVFTSSGVRLYDDREVPVLVSARDAANDQGGFVRVTWNATTVDLPATRALTGYRVWRALPAAAAAKMARPERDGLFQRDGRTLLLAADLFWELAGTQVAVTLPTYALTVPTMQDSIAGAAADQTFLVEAYDDSSHHWFSNTLVAHSVDNLAPGAITSAVGFFASGATTLYWNGVADADLSGYEVFRGTSPGFVPSDANRIATTTQLTLSDPFGAPSYYRIAARDVHGNRGPSALVVPNGTLAADDAPREFKLRAQWRAADGTLALGLDLPGADAGRLELFDVSGRRVWAAPYRTDAATALSFRVGRGVHVPAGLMLARATSESGQQRVARTMVVR